MLRFVEEILLLMLRDDGKFNNIPQPAIDRAVAGAVLMELAMENRIDTDLEQLMVVDSTPVGDSMLDTTLAQIVSTEDKNARHWVEEISRQASDIREEALNRLVERGILERQDDRFLWVFRSRRYPVIDGESEREVKLRIMGVLFSNEIPSPRDVVIICLAHSCGIFREMLSKRELDQATDRIEQVRKLDLIGQAMNQSIHDVEVWLANVAVQGRGFF
ncbi:MAG: GPP34 family phosphoprotein [Acidimicrobiia bacterium]|nr:GPP34 family phosphoprotein [Acidimicrobiia bacterium]MYC57976.1 GPP34 family phosphoprotein [Acidimicrobiia bacterium]